MICGDTVQIFNGSELCKLHLTILEAKNLPAADSNGLSDPYVEVRAEKGLFVRDGVIKTSVKHETLNPKWSHACDVSWNHKFRKLVLRVYDHDKWSKDDYLGKARIQFNELCDQAEHDVWLPLYKTQKNKESVGEIHVKYKATLKIPLVTVPNSQLLDFNRKDKDQDITIEVGWEVAAPIGFDNSKPVAKSSFLGLDYRYKLLEQISAESNSGFGGTVQYCADGLKDDEDVGSGDNYIVQLQKISVDIKYLVACINISKEIETNIKGLFVRIIKEQEKGSGRTLAFHRIPKHLQLVTGCMIAVLKRSYNGQWVFTASSHPVNGASVEENITQAVPWIKEHVTP